MMYQIRVGILAILFALTAAGNISIASPKDKLQSNTPTKAEFVLRWLPDFPLKASSLANAYTLYGNGQMYNELESAMQKLDQFLDSRLIPGVPVPLKWISGFSKDDFYDYLLEQSLGDLERWELYSGTAKVILQIIHERGASGIDKIREIAQSRNEESFVQIVDKLLEVGMVYRDENGKTVVVPIYFQASREIPDDFVD